LLICLLKLCLSHKFQKAESEKEYRNKVKVLDYDNAKRIAKKGHKNNVLLVLLADNIVPF